MARARLVLNDAQVLEVFRRLEAQGPLAAARGAKITPDPFRSLVGCILSAQSPDARTDQAAAALFAVARTPEAILAVPDGVLEEKIRPAGLYNTKARNLRAMCRDLLARFDGRVPRTRAELMSLPGIGRKCADIVLRFTFGFPVVAVDTHVHRLVNRLGLARGTTEAATAAMLEPRVPEGFRMDAHMRLIRHGRTVCTARRPRCEVCILADLCEDLRSRTLDAVAAPG